jgi:enamine deaminase RidA (YjgF/YER057c/UK114 family)
MEFILNVSSNWFWVVIVDALQSVNDIIWFVKLFKSTDFNEKTPARACYAAKGLPRNALIEIEAIALAD